MLLPHKSYERAQLTVFAGKRDMGKTTALKEFIEHREPRVFILDPFDDFKLIRQRVALKDALFDMAPGTPLRRRVVPPLVTESVDGDSVKAGAREYAATFFKAVLAGGLRDCLIVLDEMSLWSDSRAALDLQTLVLQGRRLDRKSVV